MTPTDTPAAQAAAGDVLAALSAAATPRPWRSRWDDDPATLPAADDATGQEIIVSDAPEIAALDGIPGLRRCVVGAFWYDGLNAACRREDAALIVAAVNAHDGLVAEVARLTTDLARLRAPLAGDLAAIEARAAAAVDAIIADGSDRRGVLGLDACDDDIRDEIVATWRAAVTREIVAAVVTNTGACNSSAVAHLAAQQAAHAAALDAAVAAARAETLRDAAAAVLARIVDHDGRNEAAGVLPSVYARIIVEDCAAAVAALAAPRGR